MRSSGIEIKLAEVAVAGLIKMNMDTNMESNDKQFIKAIIIATCSLKMVKSVQNIPKETLAFIKGSSYKYNTYRSIAF